jgi:hypothetical protein
MVRLGKLALILVFPNMSKKEILEILIRIPVLWQPGGECIF